MSQREITVNYLINIAAGLTLLFIGAMLQPQLERVWKWITRPAPLNPQTRGQLVTALEQEKYSLERLNHFSTHSKDLFLYILQLVLSALLCLSVAVGIYMLRALSQNSPAGYVEPPAIPVMIFLVLGALLCINGIYQAGQMSDKKINASKNRIQKRIDEITRKLNPPV